MSKIEDVKKALETNFGKYFIFTFDESNKLEIERFSTGAVKIDEALGGGIPRGRIIELFGNESSGKTTLALHIIAEAQKIGKVLFVDTEHAFDPLYAKKIGVDIGSLYFCQPNFAEEALSAIEAFAGAEDMVLIVLDSVAALSPEDEFKGEPGEAHMGKTARLMSQHLRKINPVASKNKCSIIYINQLRSKIGVVFGNPEVTTGGNALKFYAAIRMDIRRASLLKEGENIIGVRSKIKAIKNKTFIPFQEAEFDITHGRGIDTMAQLVDLAVEKDIIKKSGAWYYYGEEKFQGRDNAVTGLKENKKEIEDKLSIQINV